VFQPNPYVQNAACPANIVDYQNGAQAWQNPTLAPTSAAPIRPQEREKKPVRFIDPNTGRDIIEEFLRSNSQTSGVEEHHEDTTRVCF
jgi:hypothetical protein